ncbi:MAG: peroxidase family protein, partial [Rhizobiaceae bacterium]
MANAYRTIDGTKNNPLDPTLGQADDQLLRAVDSDYGDGVSTLAGADRPSPREISNEIFSQSESIPNEHGFSDFLWIWGQFLDHDITLSLESEAEGEKAPIPVPADDPLFDPTGSGTATINFTRSEFDPDTGTSTDNPRQQLNDITAYIDASNVYGSDDERAAALRDADGRMKMSDGELMPFNVDGLPNAMGDSETFFLGGDIRANENVVLSSMHTLFLREHNRLVTEFEEEFPGWDADTLYGEARRIVEAQMQAITYNEFLPKLLGEDALDEYKGYDVNVDPAIANIFSTAAYRLGHTMLSSTVHRTDEDGSENEFGDLSLLDAFFRPDRLVEEGGIDALLRGAATSEAESVDHQIVDDVRNFLFGPPGSGGLDLASLNIQRGRDHGLEDYNGAREAYGLNPVTSFSEITSDTDLQAKLKDVFGTVDTIDVFVGALAEDAVPGSMLGELFHSALVDQFTRLRDGDAFWYESRLSDDEIAMINETTLSDIIERNTDVETMQDDVFTAMSRSAGTAEGDVLTAGDEAYLLLGMEGDDDMVASQTAGEMHGGAGADRLFGYTANDWLVGGND